MTNNFGKPRHTRCERCILGHRPCDGRQPSCTNCTTNQRGPKTCVYPSGQPSRTELKRIKMEEENAKMEKVNAEKAKLAEQAANRKAAGITYGFGKGLYGTVPDSWPVRFGGKGGYANMIAEKEMKQARDVDAVQEGQDGNTTGHNGDQGDADNDVVQSKDSSADEIERPKRRRRKFKKTKAHIICGISSGSEVEIDIRKGFPSLMGGAPTAGPAEDIAPRAPSLGTPFDPYVNPDYFNRTRKSPEQMQEMLYRMKQLPAEECQGSAGYYPGFVEYTSAPIESPAAPVKQIQAPTEYSEPPVEFFPAYTAYRKDPGGYYPGFVGYAKAPTKKTQTPIECAEVPVNEEATDSKQRPYLHGPSKQPTT